MILEQTWKCQILNLQNLGSSSKTEPQTSWTTQKRPNLKPRTRFVPSLIRLLCAELFWNKFSELYAGFGTIFELCATARAAAEYCFAGSKTLKQSKVPCCFKMLKCQKGNKVVLTHHWRNELSQHFPCQNFTLIPY